MGVLSALTPVVHTTFAMDELKVLKADKTRMMTVDQLHERFAELKLRELRKRLKHLVAAGLVEEHRADQYNQLLYSPNAIEFLRDIAVLHSETGNLKSSVQMLVARVQGQGAAYRLMSWEELIELIHRKNREIEQLNRKIKHLRDQLLPVERRGFLQWLKHLFAPLREPPI